jgi:aminoglycoside phosphotransferase (APT) family kinase protein
VRLGRRPQVHDLEQGRVDELLDVVGRALVASPEPGFPTVPVLSVRSVQRRSSCVLYLLAVGAADTGRLILVKQRLAPSPGRAGAMQGRPRATPVTSASPAERARLEYDGLRRLRAAADPLPAVRPIVPLALLHDHAAVVMEYLPRPSLRVVMARTRYSPRARHAWDGQALRRAGEALRAYHDAAGEASPPSRAPENGQQLGAVLRRLAEYLELRGAGRPLAARLVRYGDALAAALPGDFATAIGHNDFTPRNVLVGPGGEVSVIDPLPAWQQPVYDDIASFLVGVTLIGPQLSTRGLAFRAAEMEASRSAFLAGYFAGARLPLSELYAFQLVAVLDRWAWIASASWQGSARDALPLARRRWATSLFRAEVIRLLDENEARGRQGA